ncbi:GH12357 [Drosophila grimshawi]|uniref:GH12357 n=2 Tax=Drosophila grimshawi TaxID=7222 RepID=B4JJ04_DROGR|nr:GH12357 [Drosophila grimshawi]
MCPQFCGCCCDTNTQQTGSNQGQSQDIEMKDLTPSLMITITKQPQKSSFPNRSSYSSLGVAERPNIIGSWNCDGEIEHYNTDEHEPTIYNKAL